ncbi:hypothetical protein [Sphingomonas carotinifaciens]|nr:hypothetical protein [Sphingomonas carotinifaciens]MBB4086269.1 hypothetical protein [Sphingomonas carotinifaciens]MWC42592.1 hypothetical protein [Sphingomonas carotinifaciens]
MNMHVSVNIAASTSARDLWYKALAEQEAAKQALEHYNSAIYDPIYEEIERISPRPDLCFEIEALNGQITQYRVDPTNLHAWDDHWSPVFRRKAAEVRDAWLAYRRDSERLGADAAGLESDRLCDVQCAIENGLIQTPAPDCPALLWKLEKLFGPEARDEDDYAPAWCAEWINVVMNDARRFLAASMSVQVVEHSACSRG